MSNIEEKTWKKRLRSFSDEVFRNYQIVRIRWEISSLERNRNQEIRDLGNRVFRLMKREKVLIPELDLLFKTIDELESQIQIQEEKLREVIMRSEAPKQIPGDLSAKPEQPGQEKPAEKPVEPKPVQQEVAGKEVKPAQEAKPAPVAPKSEPVRKDVGPVEKKLETEKMKPVQAPVLKKDTDKTGIPELKSLEEDKQKAKRKPGKSDSPI